MRCFKPTYFLIFVTKKIYTMKRLLIGLFLLPLFALAQDALLVVEGAAPDFYLSHTVLPKENYYSIGRMYNISPKEIAPFNQLQLESGLSPNEVIKIPLKPVNFSQLETAALGEALVPVYHTVQEKESLYRVSANFNKLSLALLRKWNNLKSDGVANGTNLIIGYLKVKKELSPLVNKGLIKPADNAAVAPIKQVEVAEKPAVIKKDLPVPEKTIAPAPVKKEVVLKAVEPAQQAPVSPTAENTTVAKNFNGGVFKKNFEAQINKEGEVSESGAGASFKSNSGWEDGKYYCLHNSATPGTVIKVTNSANGKIVYVKVLDIIPDMKQNIGLIIRISNAALQQLGATDLKFNATLTYYK